MGWRDLGGYGGGQSPRRVSFSLAAMRRTIRSCPRRPRVRSGSENTRRIPVPCSACRVAESRCSLLSGLNPGRGESGPISPRRRIRRHHRCLNRSIFHFPTPRCRRKRGGDRFARRRHRISVSYPVWRLPCRRSRA